MRNSSKWFVCGCALIALAVATGCRNAAVFKGPTFSAEDPVPTASRLTGSQVSEIQVSLCRTLEQQGNLQRAREGYRKILESDKNNTAASWRLAVISDRLGELDKSEPLYRQAIEGDSKNPDLLADYGYSLYLKRRWAEAEKILGEAKRIDPKNARVQTNLGLLLAQTDRPDEALAAFRGAGCHEAEDQSNLGLVLAMNGRDEAAQQAFEKSLSMRGDSKAARQGLTALRAKAQRSVAHAAKPSREVVSPPAVLSVGHEEPGNSGALVETAGAVTSPRSAKAELRQNTGRTRMGSPSGRKAD
ncbi:MAG: tetratricopeptide repeat protein [Planctomycetaceae bacterium]